MSEEQEESFSGPEIVPIEQDTIIFYGKPLVVVRLPDGRPAVFLRSLFDNMQLDRRGQFRRIQRTEAIADDLIGNVLIKTEGDIQRAYVLALRAVPFWLAGIDAKRVREDLRPDIIRYQREVVDILYAWASQTRAIGAPPEQKVIPSQPETIAISVATQQPGPQASITELADYHEALSIWHRWKADQYIQQWRGELEEWRGSIEERLGSEKAITDLIPEILERLGPATLTPEHHRRVQTLAQQLQKATGKPHATIYNELKTAFEKPRIQDLLEDEWPQVENWFRGQIERARNRDR